MSGKETGTGLAILEASRAHVRTVMARTRGNEQARQRQLLFQELIAELATGFIGLTGDDLSDALGRALARIAEISGAEWAALVRLTLPSEILNVTHEWAASDTPKAPRSMHGLKIMRWTLTQLRTGKVLYLKDPELLPPEATEERVAWAHFGMQSILAVPVRTGAGELLGFAAFATTSRKAPWQDDELSLFDLAAGLLRSTFEQQVVRHHLDRAELRLRKLLDSGVFGILSADLDGRIWEANDAALVAIGETRANLESGTIRWDHITPAEDLPLAMSALDRFERTGGSEPWEQDVSLPDGTRRTVLLNVGRVKATPDRFLLYAVDITADRQARQELALRTRLARLVTLFSTRLIGVPATKIGETITEALREIGNVLRLDRCAVWMRVEGSRTQAKCAFVWSKERGNSPPDSLPIVDVGDMPAWNEHLLQRRAMVLHDLRAQLREGSPERTFGEALGHRSGVAVGLTGAELPMGFVVFSSREPREWPETTVALLSLIGEIFSAAITRGSVEARQRRVQKDLATRIERRTEQLATANRELEAFSYAVAHDLRAPLRGVDGFSRILVDDHAEELPPEAQNVLHRVRATSQRMGELIDALLRLSRITRFKPQFERVDLSAIAHSVAATVAAEQPERRVDIRLQDGIHVDGEPRLLTAMMDNLIRNAWKFTSTNEQAQIEFGEAQVDGATVYFVRDDGVGFDPSQAERIFMPFQRLHDPAQFEGHGVGLATVKRIVGLHRGRVWAQGTLEEGATIFFTLGDLN